MPYGQSFQKLPGAQAPTPGDMLTQQFQKRANELQGNFANQWKAVTSKSKSLGQNQTNTVLQNIVKQAQDSAMKLQSEFNQQSQYLKSIDDLQAAGLISNGDELKWKATMGQDVSSSMFPDEAKTKTPMQQLRTTSRDADMIDRELGNFRMGTSGFKGVGQKDDRWFSTLRRSKDTLQVYNPDTDGYDVATAEDRAYYTNLQARLKKLLTVKQQLLRGGPMTRAAVNMVQKPNSHAGFTERVLASAKSKPQQAGKSRQELLSEYKRLGGSQSEEGRAFAQQNL